MRFQGELCPDTFQGLSTSWKLHELIWIKLNLSYLSSLKYLCAASTHRFKSYDIFCPQILFKARHQWEMWDSLCQYILKIKQLGFYLVLFNLEQKIWAIRLNISYFWLVGWYPNKAEFKDPSATEWFFFEGQCYNLSYSSRLTTSCVEAVMEHRDFWITANNSAVYPISAVHILLFIIVYIFY